MSRTSHLPHPAVPSVAAVGVVVANAPSMLPHSATTSGALTAGCVAALTIPAILLTRRCDPAQRQARWTLVAAGMISICSIIVNMLWQNGLHQAGEGNAPPPAAMALWAVIVSTAAVATFAALVWVPRVTAVAAALTTAVILGLAAPAQADVDTTDRTANKALTHADFTSQARRLVEQWRGAHGDCAPQMIVAVPTGSGWVDPGAIAGLHRRLGTDVPVLTLPYDHRSSWKSFVDNRSAAGEATIAVLRAITETTPEVARPAVHLYGQSLGALGAEQARRWADRHAPGLVVDTTLVGPPGDTVGDADSGSPRTVVANRSDPVPAWSPTLLWRPPTHPDDLRFIGNTMPEPPWIPVISFVQTSVDLLGALGGPAGTGHRYGSDQTMGPRPAS